MMGEMHNETRNDRDKRQGMNSTLPRSMPANEFDCESSSSHLVMRYGFCNILTSMCEWSHGCEENEWSFMLPRCGEHVRMVENVRRE